MSVKAALVNIGPQPVDATQNEIIAHYALVFSGNYGVASNSNGDIANLASGLLAGTSQIPSRVEVYEEPPAGTAPTGYHFLYAPGTNQTNGKIVVLQGASAAPDSQITQNSAYPAALTATPAPVIKVKAWFPSY